jgi:hypothetical protein
MRAYHKLHLGLTEVTAFLSVVSKTLLRMRDHSSQCLAKLLLWNMCIKFCMKRGKTAMETYKMLESVYEDEIFSYTLLHLSGLLHFKQNRVFIKDDLCTGHLPCTEEPFVFMAKYIVTNSQSGVLF